MEKLAEQWCKDRALFNAMSEGISIMDDSKNAGKDKGAIPDLISKALAITFDASVGHDYFDDSDARYAWYHRTEYRIPYNLRIFDKITKGGAARKTLTVFMAGPNVGKSMLMCHCAANAFKQGKKVLYITLEMAREKIAQRIDANLLDVACNDVEDMPESEYKARMTHLKLAYPHGKLVIEEYPPTTVGVLRFKSLLTELQHKKNFVPDIIFIDYLNLAVSSRLKLNQNTGMYSYIKSVVEEFRALAVEYNLPIITATQLNRKGSKSDSPGMEDTSESFGVPFTADNMIAIITTDQLAAENKLLMKQLKNRDNDVNFHRVFTMKVDRAKMRLMDDDKDGPVEDPTHPKAIYATLPNTAPTKMDWTKEFDGWALDDNAQPAPSENQAG